MLDLRRRLLTDDHPATVVSFGNVASNLHAQGKYVQAQPFMEKCAGDPASSLYRRSSSDSCLYSSNLAVNLKGQGLYARAQPLAEKVLEIRRRLLTDLHPATAQSNNNVATILMPRASTFRPRLSCKGRWKFTVAHSPTTTLRPRLPTTT